MAEHVYEKNDRAGGLLRYGIPNMKLEKSVMYRMYDNYCTDSGRTPLGKKRFFSIMERKGYSSRKSNGIYYFFDVTEKPEDFEAVDDMTVIPFD